ncbi:1,4-dihydroxy-2-naphthoate octaprenyltransferase [Candidatus Calditenuaceae archaeon HR02]|nr:1,4-dihydroxy-2-naphthoate octaprenyltransferase [Candidatus Calditenuaceae archaeon HR02]
MVGAEDLTMFEQVAIAFIDEDGYPSTIPLLTTRLNGDVKLRLPKGIADNWIERKKVNLILNHITPIPTGGYTDRRYAVFRGLSRVMDGIVRVEVERAYTWDERVTPFPQYVEVSTARARRYLEGIGKRLGETFKPRIGLFWSFFRTVRLPFLIATAVPVAIGTGAAFYRGFFDPLLLLLTLVGLSCIHLALNVANDYFDTILGADIANKRPTPFSGGSRAIIYGIVNMQEARLIYTSFFLTGAAVGAYLAVTRGLLEISVLTCMGLFLSYFYTAPPLKLAYRGFGEIAVFLGFGPVIVLGTYFVQTQRIGLDAIISSIPIGLLIMLILYVNEIPDTPYDREAGKMTLVTRFTKKQALGFLAGSLIATYLTILLIPLLNLGPTTILIALASAPLAYRVYRGVEHNFGDPYRMIGVMSLNVKNAAITGSLLAAGYIIGAAL